MSESNLPQRILVGLDATPESTNALRMGLWLHRRLGATVEALHVVDAPAPDDIAGRPDTIALQLAKAMDDAGQALEDRVARVLEEMVITDLGLTDVLRVSRGHPTKVLLDRAREIEADLIVIGPHQRRGRIDFGSTARSVLAGAPRAVWVQPGLPREPRRILVPFDLSDHALSALHLGRDLAESFGSELTILNAYCPSVHAVALAPGFGASSLPAEAMRADRDLAERTFRAKLEETGFQGKHIRADFVDGLASEAILARQSDHDLIVMGSHGRTGLASVFLGNVAHRVIQTAHIPVLALRHADPR